MFIIFGEDAATVRDIGVFRKKLSTKDFCRMLITFNASCDFDGLFTLWCSSVGQRFLTIAGLNSRGLRSELFFEAIFKFKIYLFEMLRLFKISLCSTCILVLSKILQIGCERKLFRTADDV